MKENLLCSIFVSLISMAAVCGCLEEEELKLVVMVTANGATNPKSRNQLNDSDIFNGTESWLKIGFDELNPNGKRQMYNLGLTMREEYKDFFNESLEDGQYIVYSEGSSKATASAVSFLSAFLTATPDIGFASDESRLYPFTSDVQLVQSLASDVNFTTAMPPSVTAPVVSAPTVDEFLFSTGATGFCKHIDTLYINGKRIDMLKPGYLSQIFPEVEPKLDQLAKRLKIRLQKTSSGRVSTIGAYSLIEFMIGRYYAMDSKEQMDIHNDPLYSYFFYLLDSIAMMTLGELHREVHALVMAPLVQHLTFTVETFAKSLAEKNNTKLVLYSGIVSNLVALQEVIFGIDGDCLRERAKLSKEISGCKPLPRFGSNFVFEVVKQQSGFFVRTRYQGEYVEVCDNYRKDGMFTCTLDDWSSALNSWVVSDWKVVCKVDEKVSYSNPTLYTIVWLLCIVFGLVVLLIVFAITLFFKREVQSSKPPSHGQMFSAGIIDFKGVTSREDFVMDEDDSRKPNVRRM